MKRMKRITAFILSAAMVLSMSVSALATGEETAICSALDGCSEESHVEGCALYKDLAAICEGRSGTKCTAEEHFEGCDEYIALTVECDGTSACPATENHKEDCLFVLAQTPVVTDNAAYTHYWSKSNANAWNENVSLKQGVHPMFYLALEQDKSLVSLENINVVAESSDNTKIDVQAEAGNNGVHFIHFEITSAVGSTITLTINDENISVAPLTITVLEPPAAPVLTGYSWTYVNRSTYNDPWHNSYNVSVMAGDRLEIGLLGIYENENGQQDDQTIPLTETTEGGQVNYLFEVKDSDNNALTTSCFEKANNGRYAYVTIPSDASGKTFTMTPTIAGASCDPLTIQVASADSYYFVNEDGEVWGSSVELEQNGTYSFYLTQNGNLVSLNGKAVTVTREDNTNISFDRNTKNNIEFIAFTLDAPVGSTVALRIEGGPDLEIEVVEPEEQEPVVLEEYYFRFKNRSVSNPSWEEGNTIQVSAGDRVEFCLLGVYSNGEDERIPLASGDSEDGNEIISYFTVTDENGSPLASDCIEVTNEGKYVEMETPEIPGKTYIVTRAIEGLGNATLTINVAAPDYGPYELHDANGQPFENNNIVLTEANTAFRVFNKEAGKYVDLKEYDSDNLLRVDDGIILSYANLTTAMVTATQGGIDSSIRLYINGEKTTIGTITVSETVDTYHFYYSLDNGTTWISTDDNRKIDNEPGETKKVLMQVRKNNKPIVIDPDKLVSEQGNFNPITILDDEKTLEIAMFNRVDLCYYVDQTNNIFIRSRLKLTNPKVVFTAPDQFGGVVTQLNLNCSHDEIMLRMNDGSNLDIITSELSMWYNGEELASEIWMPAWRFYLADNQNQFYLTPSDNLDPGTYILRFTGSEDGEAPGAVVDLPIHFTTGEGEYVLWDDGRDASLRGGQDMALGDDAATTSYQVIIKQLDEFGYATSENYTVTNVKVKEAAKDTIGLTSGAAGDCLFISKTTEGYFINHRNITPGQFQMTITVTFKDKNGTHHTQDFVLNYVVRTPNSDRIYAYVGKNRVYKDIQSAINAALESDASMRYVIIDPGVYNLNGDKDAQGMVNATGTSPSDTLTLDVSGIDARFLIQSNDGPVTINGILNFKNHAEDGNSSHSIVISGIDFTADKNLKDETAISCDSAPGMELALQNVTISGYQYGIYGRLNPSKTENVTIKHCGTALYLDGEFYDSSVNTYRRFMFIENGTAIRFFENASGKFKIRQSVFIDNRKNIEKPSAADEKIYYNAAFNAFIHKDLHYDRDFRNYFDGNFNGTDKDQFRNDFYSPYYREQESSSYSLRSSGERIAYIDPTNMDGLYIDAEEADQKIDTSNFEGQEEDIIITIANVNEVDNNTSAAEYASWNFKASDTQISLVFNPMITYELEERSQAVVSAANLEKGSYQPVSFVHAGILPSTATVELHDTVELNSSNLYLYKVENGKLVLQDEAVTYENGIYTFDRPTCSDYIITDTLIKEEVVTPPSDDKEEDDKLGSDNNEPGDSSSPSNNFSDDDSTSNTNDFISAGEVEDKLDSSKSDKVTISVVTRNKVAKKAFNELAESDKTLVLKGNGYYWTINGDDIDGKLADTYFKTGVSEDSPYKSKVKKLIGGAEYQIIYTEQHGKLPGKFTLTLKVDKELHNKLLYLYYYNPQTGKAEAMASGLKANQKGYVTIVFDDHLSTYFLTDKALTDTKGISITDKANPETGASVFPFDFTLISLATFPLRKENLDRCNVK